MPKNRKPENKDSLNPKSGKKRTNSRTKGCNAERKYARIFREQFTWSSAYNKCKTSREASRLLDDSKVDLAFIPLNAQIKKGYWKVRPKPDVIFKQMGEKLEENFPKNDPQISYPKVLIHELDGYRDEHCLVTMMFKDWIEIMKIYERCKDGR